jgi:hypothetical protein
MRLFREDPAQLDRLAQLHGRGASAELVFHPPESTRRYAEPEDVEAAVQAGVLRPLPSDPARLHFRIDPGLDRMTARFGAAPGAYRTLRPRAFHLLDYLAAQVFHISGEHRPLTVTRATYDQAAGTVLTPPDLEPATHASLHATGFAFDVRRRYGSEAQAEAFQWTLERLEALGLIAWTRGRTVIHITVSPRAEARAADGDGS